MQVQSINNQSSPNFGIRISLETIRRANQACIQKASLARSQGLTLAEYNELHRKENIHIVGNKTYALDKEKLNEAYGNALRKVRSMFSENQ